MRIVFAKQQIYIKIFLNHESSIEMYASKNKKGGRRMNTYYYIVESIDGDYANLRRTDEESQEPKLVARALLPAEITEGTRLKYEWMEYSIIE